MERKNAEEVEEINVKGKEDKRGKVQKREEKSIMSLSKSSRKKWQAKASYWIHN